VSICLPDETNVLLRRSSRTPRRLTPSNDEGRPLYIRQAGAQLTLDGGRLKVVAPSSDAGGGRAWRSFEVVASVRLLDVSQVCLFGNVQVTTQALRALFAAEVPTLYLSYGGWLQGVASPPMGKHVELRRRQVIALSQIGLTAARSMVEGKIRNSRTFLRRNGRPAPERTIASLAEVARSATQATTGASLLGFEGTAARMYFQAFPTMLRPEVSLPGTPFSFEGRNRRPPTDAVNCLLSYLYSLIVKDLVATCIGVGLDPYIGVYHRIRFGRPALALDLAEEFRPLIGDSVVVNLINNGEIRPSDFVVRAGGVGLTEDGRTTVLQSYERRLETEVTHPVFGYTITSRRVFEVQARILAAHLLGELPSYTAMVTR
jgi:CRISPR-associated protein Cas1